MRHLVVILAIALAPACDAGGSGPPVSYCSSSADCPSPMVCEFAVAAGCGAQGECGAPPAVACAPQPVCSCDGKTTNACVLDGYALASPLRSVGGCEGGGGPVDSGAGADGDATAE